MSSIASVLTAFIAVQHVGFLVLEMFLWTKPVGARVFRRSPEYLKSTAVLAANQGLYNGFLAAGLAWSFFADPAFVTPLRTFFLGCVVVAGIFGGATVSLGILFVQAVPAAVALLAVLL